MRRELNKPKKEVHFDGAISKIGYSLLPSLQSIFEWWEAQLETQKVMNDMLKSLFFST